MRRQPNFERWRINTPSLFLDANALRPPEYDPKWEVAKLLSWYEAGEILLTSPKGVELELRNESSPPALRKISPKIYTLEVGLSPTEIHRREEIIRIMAGNAKPEKHEADADHLFEAAKYGGHVFVTHDKRILKRESEIQRALNSKMLVRTLRDTISLVEGWKKPPNS